MLDSIPDGDEMKSLLGDSLYDVWTQLTACIDETYDMERTWNKGGKAWKYEYKYRRGGKTLCALYARENYAKEIQQVYEESKTYHDGKWLMFEPKDQSLFDDFMKLLLIKRKPNRT